MTILDENSEVSYLRAEEERILASFTRRLMEIAAIPGALGTGSSPTAALNAMRLPAIALDRHGYVADANAAAEVVFDDNIRIKDRRLFVRDPNSRSLLKEAIDQLTNPQRLDPPALEPVIVPRVDKLPVIVRIWPFEGADAYTGAGCVRALDVERLGSEAGAIRGNYRQDIPPHARGSQASLYHCAWRPSRYCCPRVEDYARDGAQSVEIRVCQDRYASAERARRAAIASPVTADAGRKNRSSTWVGLPSHETALVTGHLREDVRRF